ncbi:MAG: hypothetical protein ABWY06_00870 [Pseudomonas sp.]|uniref:hypothetical protein n=1 Tax=Pseudomonas sp. TaxID=306 RepID=UPI00339A7734
MARKHFKTYEAVSSAYPQGEGFKAVIALKRRDSAEQPTIHQVASQRVYDLAAEADAAANAALNKVVEVDEHGGLIWED